MKLNVDLLRQRAGDIRQSIDALEGYRSQPREQFLGNSLASDAAKYRLIVAIEAAISICTHLASRLERKTPDSYAHCFEILATSKIISEGLAERLSRMARFRNLLVHGYGQVDDNRVWDIMHRELEDLDEYLSEISKTLQQEL